MGNVPGKLEDEDSRNSNDNFNSANFSSGGRSNSNNNRREGATSRKAKSNSFVGNILRGGDRNNSADGKRKNIQQREKQKEDQAKELIVCYKKNIDGGYFAPFGCYSFEKLDYDTKIVKRLIKKRKLAPFYTPLQDYDSNWTDEELVKIIDNLPLHLAFDEHLEEYEDVPTGDLNIQDFDYLIDDEFEHVSKRDKKKLHNKIFNARLYKKRIIWQEIQNELYLENKIKNRKLFLTGGEESKLDKHLPNDKLKLQLYRNGIECPICFLYYPKNINYSRCCQQPICTECFVQIKRSPPHFPHDEDGKDEDEKDPHLLISESANCPYCAMTNFTITYTPIKENRCGYHAVSPINFDIFTGDNIDSKEVRNIISKADSSTTLNSNTVSSSQESNLPNSESTITSDTIRPTWEEKLTKEISRLERRSANATAIHVSNRLISDTNENSPDSQNNLNELEQQMIDQAIKLSLKDTPNKKK